MKKPTNFKLRVRQYMEGEGWKVSDVIREEVSLYCTRKKKSIYIRAFGNGHGHTHKRTLEKLKTFEERKGPVVIAKINGGNEIRFIHLKKQEQTILHYKLQHSI